MDVASDTFGNRELLSERVKLEGAIQEYTGEDPLEPRCIYIRWLEENHVDDELIKVLEQTLSLFKDEPKYSQDNRYVSLLIKYIERQPNPLEIFNAIYKQGRGTACAILYHAWANQYVKTSDYKMANEIYQLGISNNAEPIDDLRKVHMQLQVDVGRFYLGVAAAEPNTPCRQALRRLHVNSQLELQTKKNGTDKKLLPNVNESENKENSPSVKGGARKKVRPESRNTESDWPVAYFEPDDPSKKRMYPKDKVYAVKDKEFQLEELKALEYLSNGGRPKAACSQKTSDEIDCPVAYFEPDDPTKKRMYPKDKIYAEKDKEFQLEELMANIYWSRQKTVQDSSSKASENSVSTPQQENIQMQVLADINQSILNTNQSMTVATKEALNLVRGMWNSPSPVSVLKSATKTAMAENVCSEVPKVQSLLKPGFKLYVDESFASQLPSCSKYEQFVSVPKPGCSSDVENNGMVPVSSNKKAGGSRQLLNVRSDEIESVETHVSIKKSEIGLMETPNRNEVIASCSAQLTTKIKFVIQCDDDVERNGKVEDNLNKFVRPIDGGGGSSENDAVAHKMVYEQLDLPFIPPPVDDVLCDGDDGKENAKPKNYIRPTEKRDLTGILQPSANIPFEPFQNDNQENENNFAEDTCNTKAFAFALPSSTPFVSQFRNAAAATANEHTALYCSFTGAAEEAPKAVANTELSIILEASKERYSSSSGSSTSGQSTGYGTTGHLKGVNTYSEIKGSKLHDITEEQIQDLEKSVSKLQLGDDIDPFCPDLINKLLTHMKFPQKHHMPGYTIIHRDAPVIREGSIASIGSDKYVIEKELGKGAYARVVKATHKGKAVALKYQKPAFAWEYYIASEIRNRLGKSPLVNGFLHIKQCIMFNNASIMEMELGKYGSLIDLINTIKKATGKPMKVGLATLLSIQIFDIIEHLHKLKIIHGDVKPDNFILHKLPTADPSDLCIKLIDFGRSIDMMLLPNGTTFTKVVTTDGFQCNEMKDKRPWTYQTDYYGLAGTAYCLLIGDYMKVIKNSGKWKTHSAIPRYLNRDVWQPIFNDLLNIESLPVDLSKMRESLKTILDSKGRIISDELKLIINIIEGH